ncbi:MAG: hypothetical protein ABW007_24315 [Chitinophagaceae bacterium]
MERFKIWLKREWDEDPGKIIMLGTGVVIAATTVVKVMSEAQGRHAYAKQVNYRVNRPYDR